MPRFPHRVPIANILVSDTLPIPETLQFLAANHFPNLPEVKSVDTISAATGFMYMDSHYWDIFWRDKSLCVLSETDDIRPAWLHKAVIYFGRPVVVMDTDMQQATFHHQLLNLTIGHHFHEQIQLERGTRENKRRAAVSVAV